MFESLFIVMVVMLLCLAALDLFVGVSNDASNFLNSAVGTRIVPLAVIMLVASAGVIMGATFSSGMMEVARKGMFHPDMFTFYEIMIIFAAVMISDVLLLNLFNSFGLPTSTTVSIVFELLGAATLASVFKLWDSGASLLEIFNYIKLDRTATIVSAILLSVVIAFISGLLIQFVCRVLFSFKFNNSVKYLGGIFTGISLTFIAYFLFIKGARGASFMTPEALAWIDANLSTIIWGMFITFTVIGQVMALLGLNIFKLIILSGTFALAFSFAGNDLVNFVGVPLAALDSYEHWVGSGIAPIDYLMDCLNESSRTATGWLFAAGLIMSVTLWVSKKARQVVQTSINLSSSASGSREQFGASTLGRIITRMGLGVSKTVYYATPKVITGFVASRYQKPPVIKGTIPLPFDYVRASVNLVVASALISMATSLKLPLSTTYVTFMVAMGSSFSDGAWDRESAVFRISGVITVVAGWFLTGISAFTFSFIICFVLFNLGQIAVVILVPCVIALVIYSNFIKKSKADVAAQVLNAKTDDEILTSVSEAAPTYFDKQLECLKSCLESFFDDNETALRRTRNKSTYVLDAISRERSAYYSLSLDGGDAFSSKANEDARSTPDAKFFFYLVFSNMRESSKTLRFTIDQALNHVANRHTIFSGDMQTSLLELYDRLSKMSEDVHAVGLDPNATNIENLVKRVKKLNRRIDKCQLDLVNIIGKQRVSMHSSEMYLTFLMAMRTIINRFVSVGMQEHALAELVANGTVMTPVDIIDDENEDVVSSSDQSEAMGSAFRESREDVAGINQPRIPTEKEVSESAKDFSLLDRESITQNVTAWKMPLSPAAKERQEKEQAILDRVQLKNTEQNKDK